jgi:integrase
MSRNLIEAQLTTAAARQRLGKGVHWRSLDADVHLGYRKGIRGGRWLVRWRIVANYRQEVLGSTDDFIDADGVHCLSFHQASSKAREVVGRRRANAVAGVKMDRLTVRDVVEEYIAEREKRELGYNRDARYRLGRYVLKTNLAERELRTLTELDLQGWRSSLPAKLAKSSVQRHASDLKAALNRGGLLYRSRLPADFLIIVRGGLKSWEPSAPMPRPAQILSDDQIRAIVEAARRVDEEDGWDGDLFRMILILAASGARFSQVARLTVADLENGRLLIPTSRKGRGLKRTRTIPIRVGRDVLKALGPILSNRKEDERLLERYRWTQISPTKWVKYRRGPWLSASELVRPWRLIREIAQLSARVVPYSLRHSSIVRGLRAGFPVRYVAGMHDTSSAMIEAHYAAYIVDAMDAVAAKLVIPLTQVPAIGPEPRETGSRAA